MSAAPEKTLEADVRLPPQSRMSPRTQVAAGTTGPEAGSERSLSGRRLSSGEEKRKKKKKKKMACALQKAFWPRTAWKPITRKLTDK